jgi:large subunit ribosomal protein L28e
MANCSPDVVWSVVKDTSSYLLKRKLSRKTGMGKRGAQLTLEPNNLTGINSFKYSGLANAKTVGIEPTEKGIVLTTKSRKSDRIRKVSAASSHACCGAAADVAYSQRR